MQSSEIDQNGEKVKAEKERARKALELEARREQGAVSETHDDDDDNNENNDDNNQALVLVQDDDDDVFFITIYIYHSFFIQVKIQAWWRGIMVRHCLGQFRKNKTLKAKLMKIQKSRKQFRREKNISLNGKFMSVSEKIQGVGNNFSNKHDGKGERKI